MHQRPDQGRLLDGFVRRQRFAGALGRISMSHHRKPGAQRRAGSARTFLGRSAFCPSYRAFGRRMHPCEAQFLGNLPTDSIPQANPLRVDAFALQCHMADMNNIKTICVYCGSGAGTNPRFVEAATEFGKILAESRISLVYGGGALGLMGAVAASVLAHGGTAIGIIPEFLATRERI